MREKRKLNGLSASHTHTAAVVSGVLNTHTEWLGLAVNCWNSHSGMFGLAIGTLNPSDFSLNRMERTVKKIFRFCYNHYEYTDTQECVSWNINMHCCCV